MIKHDYLQSLKQDMGQKILILTGPRQCGKTTLSKMLTDDYQCLNYDLAAHRLAIKEKRWDRSEGGDTFVTKGVMHEGGLHEGGQALRLTFNTIQIPAS